LKRNHLSDTLSADGLVLHLGERMKVGADIGEDGLLVRPLHVNVLGVEELGNAQVPLGHVKGAVEVVAVGVRVQSAEVEEVGPLRVDEGAEGEAVAPAAGEVEDADARVAGRLALAPEQQGLLGRPPLLRLVLQLDLDVLDLEAEDDGPDEAEDERGVAGHDVLGADALQLHLGLYECQRSVHVLDLVHLGARMGGGNKQRETSVKVKPRGC